MEKKTNHTKSRRTAKSNGKIYLRLYVAGQTPRSVAALANLKAICEEHVPGKYSIEIIDLLLKPQLASGRPDSGGADPGAPVARPDSQNHWRFIEQGKTFSRIEHCMKPNKTPKSGRTKTKRAKYAMRLYVTGATPKSTAAITNLRKLCDEHLSGKYELKVIDVYQQPKLAQEGQIIAAPTLVKSLPLALAAIHWRHVKHEKSAGWIGNSVGATGQFFREISEEINVKPPIFRLKIAWANVGVAGSVNRGGGHAQCDSQWRGGCAGGAHSTGRTTLYSSRAPTNRTARSLKP